ncbi:MAG: cell division protein FtsA [Synergistaceae bacterium]|nr:cell division protein FtsA [Synergistaceae bacterium]
MPGKSDNLIVGLSIGTTKTFMIVAEKNPNYPDSVQVIGFGPAPSKGITKGIIVNLPDARQSVMRALQEAQSITGVPAKRLKNVIVAFNAHNVKSEPTHGMITLGGRESRAVSEEALRNVIARARDLVSMRSDICALHMIPTRYELDGQNVDDPLDMNGNKLDVWLQTVTFPMTFVQNVVSCVRGADLNVKGLVLKPLAASLGAIYEDEMRVGCISINIGGGTTGIVLYRGGRAFHVTSIPIGGEHVSRDLAMVLHLTLREAEFLKKKLFVDSEDELRSRGIDVDTAFQVVVARLEELFDVYIRNALAECTPQNFPGGIILSGGVALMPGIDVMMENILQMPVRIADRPIYNMPDGLDNAAYVDLAGILKYASITDRDPYVFMKPEQPLPGLSVQSDEQQEQPKKRSRFFGGIPDEEEDEEETPQPDSREEDEEPEETDDDDDEPRESVGDKLKRFLHDIGKMF